METSIYRGEKSRYDLAGQIDSDGKVWRGEKSKCVLLGEVDNDGKVWRGEKSKCVLVGEVDSDGRVWRGEKSKCVLLGEVDNDGKVWRGEKSKCVLVGEMETSSHSGGAALLLLLEDQGGSGGLLSEIGNVAAAAAVTEGVRLWQRSRRKEAVPLPSSGGTDSRTPKDLDSLQALEDHRRIHGRPKEAAFVRTSGDDVAEAAATAGMSVWQYLEEEEDPLSPQALEKLMRPHWNIRQVSCLVLEGSRKKLETYVGKMYRPQLVLYCGQRESVDGLGLNVIDEASHAEPMICGLLDANQKEAVTEAARSLGCGVVSLSYSQAWNQEPSIEVADAMIRISSWSYAGRPMVVILSGPARFLDFYTSRLKAAAVIVCLSDKSGLEQTPVPELDLVDIRVAIEGRVGSRGREIQDALRAFELPLPGSLSGSCKVELKNKGPNPSRVILAIKEYVGGDTLRAFKIAHEPPSVVLEGINKVLAEGVAETLRNAGAEVVIRT